MQRVQTIISATLLIGFMVFFAFKLDPDYLKSHKSVTIEECDLKDVQDEETEELNLHLKYLAFVNDLNCTSNTNSHKAFHYHFAIKSYSQQTHSPPPELSLIHI